MDYTSDPIECRVDWITLTCSKPERRLHFFNLGQELVKLATPGNLAPRRWHWKGYDGLHVQGVTFGRRPDSDILQLSGPLADEHLDLAWQHADNCTRIDFAVTVRVEEDVSAVIGEHESQVANWHAEKPRSLSYTLIKSNGQPATLYLGQRVSDFFARVYDKHLESGEPAYEQCVRYEVEVKGTPADRAIAWLSSTGDRSSRIRDFVHKHCVRRGLAPRFGCVGGEVPIKAIRPTSDTSTRLAWLATSVRPVVERLLAADRAAEVIEALGLRRSVTEMARLRAQLEWGNHQNELFSDSDDQPADG